MIFSHFKHYEDKTVLEVTKTKNGELIREVVFIPGNQYIVNPLNKHKKKYRGRFVMLEGIESSEGVLSAKVKYLDTYRSGKIILDDLDNILQ